ncbi:MAG TPA: hypothetical protein VMY41_19750, partial [Thermohalobaculum sp.]|nr:hypothetical protein [Thermohalobaculum sp.]
TDEQQPKCDIHDAGDCLYRLHVFQAPFGKKCITRLLNRAMKALPGSIWQNHSTSLLAARSAGSIRAKPALVCARLTRNRQ